MGKEKDVYQPLVYIDQPRIRHPEAAMQDFFESSSHNANQGNESQFKRRRPGRPQPYMHAQSIWEDEDLEEELDEEDNDDRGRSFSQLSIRGKIDYLLKGPEFIPNLTCRIHSTDGRHIGKITDFKEGLVYLRLSRSYASKQIPLDSIEDISIVGF